MPKPIELPGATGALPGTPTALIVEDCLYSAEALRLMARACGLRSRHAATLEAAERHLAIFRPAFAIVDLGLPDGCGQTLLRRIAQDSVRPLVLAISADPSRLSDPQLDGLADVRCEKPIASAKALHTLLTGSRGLSLTQPQQMAAQPARDVLTLEIDRIGQILAAASEPAALHRAAGRLEGLAAELGEGALRAEATACREMLQAEGSAKPGALTADVSDRLSAGLLHLAAACEAANGEGPGAAGGAGLRSVGPGRRVGASGEV
ncbi:MAG: response regulator [Pseudomonadota bacterium]